MAALYNYANYCSPTYTNVNFILTKNFITLQTCTFSLSYSMDYYIIKKYPQSCLSVLGLGTVIAASGKRSTYIINIHSHAFFGFFMAICFPSSALSVGRGTFHLVLNFSICLICGFSVRQGRHGFLILD